MGLITIIGIMLLPVAGLALALLKIKKEGGFKDRKFYKDLLEFAKSTLTLFEAFGLILAWGIHTAYNGIMWVFKDDGKSKKGGDTK
jgi:hypothetical protein